MAYEHSDRQRSSATKIVVSGGFGAGKTTLLKILAGLLPPSSGTVLLDDVPVPALGMEHYRSQIGCVLQDDRLFAGSVADNISAFHPAADPDRIQHAAKLAAMHEEIMRMPMGYQTLVGDMGSSLSGGQKQRVLLARALYKRPKILFLDEGTAHLDVENEQRINERLRQLSITRISVAHRPEMMSGADTVLRLGHGSGLAAV